MVNNDVWRPAQKSSNMILKRSIKRVALKLFMQFDQGHIRDVQWCELLGLLKLKNGRNMIEAELLVAEDERALQSAICRALGLDLILDVAE